MTDLSNIMSAGVVDREFVNIYCPLGSLECLGFPLGGLLAPFGVLRIAIGCHLGLLWLPWNSFGSLRGGTGLPLVVLWGPLAAFGSP